MRFYCLISIKTMFWNIMFIDAFGVKLQKTRLTSFDIRILITSLWYLLAIVLLVLLRYTDSDYPLGIFWPLCCLFFLDIQILIIPLVSFGHCVQTTQWPKEKVHKDKQRSTKHTHKTKDQVTWTPLKTEGELRCSGRESCD
jgi:hypothetical protein